MCRASVEFDHVGDLARFLEVVCRDPDVIVVRAKNRCLCSRPVSQWAAFKLCMRVVVVALGNDFLLKFFFRHLCRCL